MDDLEGYVVGASEQVRCSVGFRDNIEGWPLQRRGHEGGFEGGVSEGDNSATGPRLGSNEEAGEGRAVVHNLW